MKRIAGYKYAYLTFISLSIFLLIFKFHKHPKSKVAEHLENCDLKSLHDLVESVKVTLKSECKRVEGVGKNRLSGPCIEYLGAAIAQIHAKTVICFGKAAQSSSVKEQYDGYLSDKNHEKSRKVIKFMGDYKHVCYVCRSSCGGFGDRLRGVIFSFYTALANSAGHCIEMNYPVPFYWYFQPMSNSSLFYKFIKDSAFDNDRDPDNYISGQELLKNWKSMAVFADNGPVSLPVDDRLVEISKSDHVLLRGNSFYWHEVLNQNVYKDHFQKYYPFLFDLKSEELAAIALYLVMGKITPELELEIRDTSEILGAGSKNTKSIGVHFRLGDVQLNHGGALRHSMDETSCFVQQITNFCYANHESAPSTSILVTDEEKKSLVDSIRQNETSHEIFFKDDVSTSWEAIYNTQQLISHEKADYDITEKPFYIQGDKKYRIEHHNTSHIFVSLIVETPKPECLVFIASDSDEATNVISHNLKMRGIYPVVMPGKALHIDQSIESSIPWIVPSSSAAKNMMGPSTSNELSKFERDRIFKLYAKTFGDWYFLCLSSSFVLSRSGYGYTALYYAMGRTDDLHNGLNTGNSVALSYVGLDNGGKLCSWSEKVSF